MPRISKYIAMAGMAAIPLATPAAAQYYGYSYNTPNYGYGYGYDYGTPSYGPSYSYGYNAPGLGLSYSYSYRPSYGYRGEWQD